MIAVSRILPTAVDAGCLLATGGACASPTVGAAVDPVMGGVDR
jgi:hypothetical protein